jgi:hypothetical protein
VAVTCGTIHAVDQWYNVHIWLVAAYADHWFLLLMSRYIKGIMKQLGLVVREDAVGNIFGRWWVGLWCLWDFVVGIIFLNLKLLAMGNVKSPLKFPALYGWGSDFSQTYIQMCISCIRRKHWVGTSTTHNWRTKRKVKKIEQNKRQNRAKRLGYAVSVYRECAWNSNYSETGFINVITHYSQYGFTLGAKSHVISAS